MPKWVRFPLLPMLTRPRHLIQPPIFAERRVWAVLYFVFIIWLMRLVTVHDFTFSFKPFIMPYIYKTFHRKSLPRYAEPNTMLGIISVLAIEFIIAGFCNHIAIWIRLISCCVHQCLLQCARARWCIPRRYLRKANFLSNPGKTELLWFLLHWNYCKNIRPNAPL